MGSRSSSTVFHVLVAGFITLGVIGSRLVFRSWYAVEFRRAGAAAAALGSRERERDWQRLRYIELTNVSLADILMERIRWEQLALEQPQTLKLKARLAQVAAYLQNPSFDDYYRLRTEGLTCRLLDPESSQSLHADPYAGNRSTQGLLSTQGLFVGRAPPPSEARRQPNKERGSGYDGREGARSKVA